MTSNPQLVVLNRAPAISYPTTLESCVLIPNAAHAIIEPEKLHGYLLSASHPVGRFKARFFAALGFTSERWAELDDALRDQHLSQEIEMARTERYGRFYTIRAILIGPAGASAPVVSIWCIRTGEERPRFVTAYPGGTE